MTTDDDAADRATWESDLMKRLVALWISRNRLGPQVDAAVDKLFEDVSAAYHRFDVKWRKARDRDNAVHVSKTYADYFAYFRALADTFVKQGKFSTLDEAYAYIRSTYLELLAKQGDDDAVELLAELRRPPSRELLGMLRRTLPSTADQVWRHAEDDLTTMLHVIIPPASYVKAAGGPVQYSEYLVAKLNLDETARSLRNHKVSWATWEQRAAYPDPHDMDRALLMKLLGWPEEVAVAAVELARRHRGTEQEEG
jgi:hypothetical protein